MAFPFLLLVLTFLRNKACVEASSSIAPNDSSYKIPGKFQTFDRPCMIKICSYIYYIYHYMHLYFPILHISIDCKCNETVMHGYGMCRKRSSRYGGNFLCAVDEDSKCKDIIKEPGSGISISVDACKSVNVGKVRSNF